jgi:sugar-specific transcriptional regulator TrmB
MYQDILKKAGLTGVQAEIYDFLLGHSNWKASDIAREIKRPRGVVYKGLDELITLGLAQKKEDENMVTRFLAEHPTRIEQVFARQEDELKENHRSLRDTLPNLISAYNLANNRPGVRFFEGKDGIKEVLKDTLYAQDTLLSYSDIEAINKYIKDINDWYVGQRERKQIKKRAILLDSPFARDILKGYHTGITENRFIDHQQFDFSTVMHIYDNKVSYISLADENMIGVIIDDRNIYGMHRSLFEYAWSQANDIDQLPDLSKAQ